MDRIKKIHDLVEIFAGTNVHKSTTTLAKELSQKIFDETNEVEDVVAATVKDYIEVLQKHLNYSFDVKRGTDGGYRFTEETRAQIASRAILALSVEEKNALNDAFEIAERNITYLYHNDLKSAKEKLYTKYHMKKDDGEYYVGFERRHSDKTRDLIIQIKNSILQRRRINMESHYDDYGITKKEMKLLMPLFVVHDADESFVILKNHNLKSKHDILYQNILNIKTWQETKLTYPEHKYKIKDLVNEHTIKVKGLHELSFTISTEKGFLIFDTWNYDFKDLKLGKQKQKQICFYEEYRVYEFLLRMIPHIKDLKMEDYLKEKFKRLIKNASESLNR